MKRAIASLLVALGACEQRPTHRGAADLAEEWLAAPQAAFVVDAGDGVVLERDALTAIRHPCSRGFPPGLTGYWAPTTDELKELEQRLPARLAQDVPLRSRPLNTNRIVVRRQYVGMLRAGVKVIYVSGMPAESLVRHGVEWRRGPLHVCGGGAAVFGLVYDTRHNSSTALRAMDQSECRLTSDCSRRRAGSILSAPRLNRGR